MAKSKKRSKSKSKRSSKSGGYSYYRRRKGLNLKRYLFDPEYRTYVDNIRKQKQQYWQWVASEEGGLRGTKASLAKFGLKRSYATPEQLAARDMYAFKGRGDYKKWARYIPRGLGAIGGAVAGSWASPGNIAAMIGGAEKGWNAGANVSKFIGWGDYNCNQIVNPDGEAGGGNSMQISVNPINESGDIAISNTEFVGNIYATGAAGSASGFELRAYALNPGLDGVFPFLAQLAQNFVMYDFEGLMFHYKPCSGTDAGQIALGKVIMATEYDPDARPFRSSMEMESYDYACSGATYQNQVHGVETHPAQRPLGNMMYVRSGAVAKDKSWTDLGTFYVGTESVPIPASGSALIGELWVSYRCRLSRTNLNHSLLGENINYDFIRTSHTADLSVSAATYKTSNTLGVVVANVTADTVRSYTFPERVYGTYLFNIFMDTSTANFQWNTPTATSGVIIQRVGASGAGVTQAPASLAGPNDSMCVFLVHIPATVIGQPVITVSHTALSDSSSIDSTFITEVAYSMLEQPFV